MSRFFQDIVDYNLFKDWAKTLDWIFDDNKFDSARGWTSGYVGSYIKKIKKLPSFSIGKTYQYSSKKTLKFPDVCPNSITVIFSKGDGECKDFIRHIRNGIAHGQTRCFKNNSELFVEIKDYDGSGNNQTAYMCFPLSYITEIYKLYCDVKKSYENGKNKIKEHKKEKK